MLFVRTEQLGGNLRVRTGRRGGGGGEGGRGGGLEMLCRE